MYHPNTDLKCRLQPCVVQVLCKDLSNVIPTPFLHALNVFIVA